MRIGFVLLLVLSAIAACSDDDPQFGPPGGIAGRTLDFDDAAATSVAGDAGSDDGGGLDTGVPADASAVVAFAALYATITDPDTPPANSVCIPCHRDSQNPMFVKSTAESTRAGFLTLGFDNISTGRFYNKGQHGGDPLTALQRALARQWSEAESAEGD